MAILSKEEKRLRAENFKLQTENRKLKVMLVHMQFALKESARKMTRLKGDHAFMAEADAVRNKLKQIQMSLGDQ